MTVVSGFCRYPPTTAWMVVTLAFGTCAFGQEIRFFPIRTSPLGSPAGTAGDPVTPQYNVDLGCWELMLSAGGVEVELDLQAFGWGNADCAQPTGLCRVDPGDDCTLPSDCPECTDDAVCPAGTCTDNGATCLEADHTGSGDPCISNTDCTQGTETCRGRLAPCSLGAIQGTVISALYDNGVGGTLVPKGWPGDPGLGAYQVNKVCSGSGKPCIPPFDASCDGMVEGFCIANTDWVMPVCAADFSAVATSNLNFAYATVGLNNCNIEKGTCDVSGNVCSAGAEGCPAGETCNAGSCSISDEFDCCAPGETCVSDVKTLGILILEVPVDAAGTYMIDFDSDPINSFMTAGDGILIPGVVYTPACITLTCQSDADCDDGVSCTTDSCDEGTSTCENIVAQDSCLIDDICYANEQLDPAEECHQCVSTLSQTDWTNRFAGTACGDPTESDCDHPDTCDGAGSCLTNVAPPGTACTDDGNDCTRDTCSAGACTHRNWASGTLCGDAADVPCNGADTCDGSGSCLNNVLPDDAPCPNGNFCDGAELCLGGVCQSADPPCDLETDLCDEQDDECDLLGDHDGDLLITLSDFLHWPDCETGPVGGHYAVGCEIFDFEQNGFVDLRDYARFLIAFTMP